MEKCRVEHELPAELFSICQEISTDLGATTAEELGALDFKVSRLASTLGPRVSESDPIPVLQAVHDLATQVEKFQSFMKEFHEPGGAGTQLGQKLHGSFLQALAPVVELYNDLSTSATTPGDKLAQELAFLRQEVASLKAAQSSVPVGAQPSGWSLGAGPAFGQPPTPPPIVQPSVATAAALQLSLIHI